MIIYWHRKERKPWLTLHGQLNIVRHENSQLKKDWNELGFEAFTYEVLEEKEANEATEMCWGFSKWKAMAGKIADIRRQRI